MWICQIKEKAIIQLDPDEVASLLDYIENYGNQLTGVKLYHYNKQKYRDIAIVTLLLGTGVRVSELVGLNISDIDFKNNGIRILRKGGNEMIVYFGEEVEKALRDYLEISRNAITPLSGHEDALFLSGQRKRISVDAVEKMVKKYASAISAKTITPHKLRSTYGTALYRETGDIYLVADVLGHADVNTTKKTLCQIKRRQKAGCFQSCYTAGKNRLGFLLFMFGHFPYPEFLFLVVPGIPEHFIAAQRRPGGHRKADPVRFYLILDLFKRLFNILCSHCILSFKVLVKDPDGLFRIIFVR